MSDPRKRFKGWHEDKLVRVNKNLHINRSDPHYYEKVLRYADPHSAEAHYRLAQDFEHKGLSDRALFHYHEAMKTYPSPYYFDASAAIRRMAKPQAAPFGLRHTIERSATNQARPTADKPSYAKRALLALLFISAALLIVLYGSAAVSKAVTIVKPWSVGKQVTFENAEIPFLMHFPYNEPPREVEKVLHKKALELAHTYPKQSILIYGVVSPASSLDSQARPLAESSWKDKAFVVAAYNPLVDSSVKIRFLSPDFQTLRPLTEAAANLVRTGLQAFIAEHGAPPATVEQLRENYPNNYLSFIPLEAVSGSAHVRTVFNGGGGWVYDSSQRIPERMFYPNVLRPQGEDGLMPFEPVTVIVDKQTHTLKVEAGAVTLAEYPVGLGTDNRTPEGAFAVTDRVRTPAGKQPGVYGAAALGFGDYAIHGTPDVGSIGQDRSLGCIRLANEDMMAIFPYVPKGALVKIRGTGESPGDKFSADLPAVSPALLFPDVRVQESPDETAGGKLFHWLG